MKKIMACGLALCLLSAALSGCWFRIDYPTEPDPGTGGTVEPPYGEETSPVQTTPADITSEEPPFQDQPIPGEEPDEPGKPSLEFHKFDLPNNDFDTGVMYTYDYDKKQVVLYMETWNEYVTIENITDHDYTAFLIDQDTGVFITQVLSAKNNRTFRVDRFQKGSSEIVSSTFEASLAGTYYDMYYYPVNDQTGYLAICGVMLDDLPNGTVVFFKTTDCGLTWQEVSEHGSFRFSCHAHMPHPVFFCMFTENIGMFSLSSFGDSAPVFITRDGWKTYEEVLLPEIYQSTSHENCTICMDCGGEVIHCSYADGTYILKARKYRACQNQYVILQFTSYDLKNWAFSPEPDGK